MQRDAGGSGTFYYAVVAIRKGAAYLPTNALFLGDRITPNTLDIIEGRAVYTFADRKKDEHMAVKPSVPTTVRVQYTPMTNKIMMVHN